MFARAGFRIAALQPVEPDDVDGLVFVMSTIATAAVVRLPVISTSRLR